MQYKMTLKLEQILNCTEHRKDYFWGVYICINICFGINEFETEKAEFLAVIALLFCSVVD